MQSIRKKLEGKEAAIGVVGLGYVGLPLACLLASKFKVVGFDINAKRVDELTKGVDLTREVEEKAKLLNPSLKFTTDAEALRQCPVIIVAVPTPVDGFKVPDLTPLVSASKSVGKVLSKGTIVCYESTVYPGLTESVCGKQLAETSGLKCGVDFFLGYSPERVNPGDKLHTIDRITKVVSGQTPEVLDLLAWMYGSVIPAGIHRAASIATAEAAKVIENTQRDINIALVNELAVLFDKIGLDTQDVLAASRTKWNFLDFRPGLVGGHCIGVDPYYLTYLASGQNLHPKVILSGREINDSMGRFVGEKAVNLCLNRQKEKRQQRPLSMVVLGVTFKENVPDLRNSKVIDVVETLENFGVDVYLHDPVVDPEEFHEEYKRHITPWDKIPDCDAAIVAVKHDVFAKEYPLERIVGKLRDSRVVLDLKAMFDREAAKTLGVALWRL